MTSRPLSPAPQLPPALSRAFEAAVAAAHPAQNLPAHLPPFPAEGRLILLAAGKAAGAMVQVAERHYRAQPGFDPSRLVGSAVARHGYGAATLFIPVREAGHPVPDQASIEAADAALRLAASATARDRVLVLLSGGGSANWVAPQPGLTLADKQAINRALLRSGASIDEINAVRKRLSRIKGGRLALAAHPAPILTLAISDVPGDDPGIIASGPTWPDDTTHAQARLVIARYAIALPDAAHALLADTAPETPKPQDPAFAAASYTVIATPRLALDAAAAVLTEAGYELVDLGGHVEGEAREVAAHHAAMALKLKAEGRRAAILSGGELTVTIRGKGRGGPNQEYALALAIALDGAAGITALAGDTDGTDGGGGEPTDPAGAIIDVGTLARARAQGVDAEACLAANDSTGFFERAGGLLTPGPTLTNVNDCRIILIDP